MFQHLLYFGHKLQDMMHHIKIMQPKKAKGFLFNSRLHVWQFFCTNLDLTRFSNFSVVKPVHTANIHLLYCLVD